MKFYDEGEFKAYNSYYILDYQYTILFYYTKYIYNILM